MHKITAEHIFDGKSFVQDKVVVYDDKGTILSVDDASDHDPSSVRKLEDKALCPGLVNTHCHLELSHMKGLVATGTSLLPFLQSVVKFRDFDQEIIDAAIKAGDKEMYDAGIVAVGDISNKADTAAVKDASEIDYYTFVEMFDFMSPAMTASVIDQYSAVYQQQSETGRNKKSLVPHAPYTVSPELYKYINDHNDAQATVSIHNQETPEENHLFESGTGGFVPFFEGFGVDMSTFKPAGTRSLQVALSHMQPKGNTLFVHNTTCLTQDLRDAKKWSEEVYFCSCPNANLYIENTLPNYQTFVDEGVVMTLGTDSLTSNWQLSILEEVAAIRKYCSYISLPQVLRWATSNGAKALGFDDLRGDIAVGKRPGILAIDVDFDGGFYHLKSTRVDRII